MSSGAAGRGVRTGPVGLALIRERPKPHPLDLRFCLFANLTPHACKKIPPELRSMEHGKLETRVADLEDEVFGETRASIFMAMSPSNSPNSRERVQEGYERYSQNYIAQQLEHVPLLDTEWTTLPSVPCESVAANDRIVREIFFQIAEELCRHHAHRG
jgi:hypothetical protein